MGYNKPTVQDFKDKFARDFPYGTDPATGIIDGDITQAYLETDANLNEGLFDSQANFTLGYLLLAAHCLVISIRSSSQGITGQYSWIQNSKSVGSVSEGIAIPQRILDQPEFAMLSKTNYGARFLMMVLPQLCGQVFTVCGGTTA